MRDVQAALIELEIVDTDLDDPKWWKRLLAWIDSESEGIYVITELKGYIAHQDSQSKAKRHKNLKRGFRNWLATRKRWNEQKRQREAARR